MPALETGTGTYFFGFWFLFKLLLPVQSSFRSYQSHFGVVAVYEIRFIYVSLVDSRGSEF